MPETLEALTRDGYHITELRHAGAILGEDYAGAADELAACLRSLRIDPHDLIVGGGGKSRITHALEDALNEAGWRKKNFEIELVVDRERRLSQTHEIDHYLAAPRRSGIALEIEWNNKDPFYDRDLETFSRLHSLGVISIGVIITRGPKLQDALEKVFRDHYRSLSQIEFESDMRAGGANLAKKAAGHSGADQRDAYAHARVQSKFGAATTHWSKLQDRIDRGLGSPCPLLLIGIEPERLRGSGVRLTAPSR